MQTVYNEEKMMTTPLVSVCVSAYESHDTIRRCLECLRAQTFQDFEVIVVDSSPSDRTATIMTDFPEVHYHHSKERLYPFEARNKTHEFVRGEILIAIDPDVYAIPTCLEQMVSEYQRTQRPIMGALDCYGDKILDWGIHFCKFSQWLPNIPAHSTNKGATANLLYSRKMLDEVGGFDGSSRWGADLTFTMRLNELGYPLLTAPNAVVEHHHISTLRAFLKERYIRGKDYGFIRIENDKWSKLRMALWIPISILPVRVISSLIRTYRLASQAKLRQKFLGSIGVVALGYMAWFWGEVSVYRKAIFSG
jgi:glycosyltransferase involved in cell wall biosynthesis